MPYIIALVVGIPVVLVLAFLSRHLDRKLHGGQFEQTKKDSDNTPKK